MPDTYQAAIRFYSSTGGRLIQSFPVEYENIEDDFEDSVAQYEFPYMDGGLLENMGAKPRQIRIRCYFYNENYAAHIDLINAWHNNRDADVEFVHPMYGLIAGLIQSMVVRADERDLTAGIDLVFIESISADIDASPYEDVEGAAESKFADSQQEQMDAYSDSVKKELGPEAQSVLNKVLDPNAGIMGQFNAFSAKVQAYVKKVDIYVTKLEATLTEISNPANSLISTIDYGVNLPGRVIGALANTCERYAMLYTSLKTAPCRFLTSLKSGLTELEDSLGLNKQHTRAAAACRVAVEAAYLYKTDEENRQVLKAAEAAKSFDAEGNYLNPSAIAWSSQSSANSASSQPVQVMTVGELEYSLGGVRSFIQSSIDLDRETPSAGGQQALKEMALTLLQHVKVIKLESEKIIAVQVNNQMPLHLVCLNYGLPYNYAERIWSINKIKNPNFVQGRVDIYAR